MRLLFCLILILLPLACWAKDSKCYLFNNSENRAKFLIHLTGKEKYYILDKLSGTYTSTDILTCLSDLDFPAPRYSCVITD